MLFACCAGAEGGQVIETLTAAEAVSGAKDTRPAPEPLLDSAHEGFGLVPEPPADEPREPAAKPPAVEPAGAEAPSLLERIEEAAEAAVAEVKALVGAAADAAPADAAPADSAEPVKVNQYSVAITKSPGSALGLDLDLLDGKYAQVVSLKPGLVKTHNETADVSKQVNAGDYISAVNGVNNKPEQFIDKFKQETELVITFLRPLEFTVSITKNGGSLGMDLNYAATSCTLLVLKVNAGRISEWNEQNPDSKVQPGDRIVAVNGVRGVPTALLEQIKAGDQLVLTFVRPAQG